MRTLSVEIDGNTYISKQFDFETMCLIDEQKETGVLRVTQNAIKYMFQDVLSEEQLDALSSVERTRLSMQIMKWFTNDMMDAQKKTK